MNVHSPHHPLWSIGFRPFFLITSLFSFLSLLYWVGHFLTFKTVVHFSSLLLWHQHEMIFGFSIAVISGFLLTASQNWTGVRGVYGRRLQLLVLLFFLGRITPFMLFLPAWVSEIIDLCYLPSLILFLSPYLLRPEQKRNSPFLLLLGLLWTLNLCFYLSQHSLIPNNWQLMSLKISLHLILVFLVVISERVIPFFSGNIMKKKLTPTSLWRQRLHLWGLIVFSFIHGLYPNENLSLLLSFILGSSLLWTFFHWPFKESFRWPILNILYWGFLFLSLGYIFYSLQLFLFLPPSAITHWFTVGGLGVLVYGMLTRVSLGHSGRPIVASRPIQLGYITILLSALFRSLGPVIFPENYKMWVIISGSLWVLAYFIVLIIFTPIWLKPRT